jgi:hypothetical protein
VFFGTILPALGQEVEAEPAPSLTAGSPPEEHAPNPSALAEELFRQARTAWDNERFEEACAKFRESERLEASPGTVLNVARCESHEGRVASAWASYLKAARLARSSGREAIVVEGEARARELESRLSYVTVRVVQSAQGESVLLGTQEVRPAAYGTRLPVDPGKHVLTARAKGRIEWRKTIELKEAESLVVEVPPLMPQLEAPPPRTVNPWPWILGGSGLAALVGGVAAGFVAKDVYNKAEDLCPTHEDCPPGALEKDNEANTFANVSNVLVPVGALALGGGILWLVLQPNQKQEKPRPVRAALVPLGEGGAEARLEGHFF